MDCIYHYHSPLGGITLAGGGESLTGLWFDGQAHFGETLGREYTECDLPVFAQAVRWLDLYFSGRIPDFTPPIVLRTTPFRRAVCEILLTIPYGCTMTYGEIADRIAELAQQRVDKQPLEFASAGSTFKRPEGYFAGKLIQDAGLKGFSVGDAQVSEKHAGFVINRGGASAAQIRELIEEVIKRVEENSGVRLEREVIYLGEF